MLLLLNFISIFFKKKKKASRVFKLKKHVEFKFKAREGMSETHIPCNQKEFELYTT